MSGAREAGARGGRAAPSRPGERSDDPAVAAVRLARSTPAALHHRSRLCRASPASRGRRVRPAVGTKHAVPLSGRFVEPIPILSPSRPLAHISWSARPRRSGQGRPQGRRKRTLDAIDGRATVRRARGRPDPWHPSGSSAILVAPLPEVRCPSLRWLGASHVSRPGKPARRQAPSRVPVARATAGHCSLGLAGGSGGRELQICNYPATERQKGVK